MKYFRPISVISILILLVSLNACGGGDPSVNSLNNNYSSDLNNMNLNTGNIGLDGLVIDGSPESAKVLPGSSHLITAPSNSDGSGFIASCSAGSWKVGGRMVGNEAESVDGSFEWVAPMDEIEAQIVIKPSTGGKSTLYGLVVIVSVNPGEIDLSPDEPVDEIMFTDLATGFSAPAAEGELLVKLTPETSITEILSLRTAQDYRVIERISRDEYIFRMKFDPSVDLNLAMREIAPDSRV